MSKLLLVRHECLSFYLSKVDKQITKDEDLFPARQHKLGFDRDNEAQALTKAASILRRHFRPARSLNGS
jgi:hypothetical protein